MGGTALCPAGTAGEGNAGDQENGDKASGKQKKSFYNPCLH